MMTGIREWLLAWQMRRWIRAATVAVYSEELDVDGIARGIVGDGSNSRLLRAYIAIRIAADTKLGKEYQLDRVLEEVRAAEIEWHDYDDDQDFLELRRLEADVSLKKVHLEFAMEKLAPEFSYIGTVYRAEKRKKGPLSRKERERFKAMCDQLGELDRRIEACRKSQDEDTAGTERPG